MLVSDGEEPLPPARRAVTLNDAVFHYPPAQPAKVPFLPLGAMQDTSPSSTPCHNVEQRPTGSLNDVSQGIGAELDLALGLMKAPLGAEQMVAKDGDIKPDAKLKVMEDPESKGELDDEDEEEADAEGDRGVRETRRRRGKGGDGSQGGPGR